MLRYVTFVCILIVLFAAGLPARGQDDSNIMIDFMPYDGNPILPHGEPGVWDAAVWYSKVIFHDGLFHMLYHGYSTGEDKLAIGYATSDDGLNWTRYEGNPVFEPNPPLGKYVGITGVIVEDDTWIMYVCSVPALGTVCDTVYQATASEPTATWIVDPEPLLEAGKTGEWDSPQIWPNIVLKTDEAYVLYYSAKESRDIGMATSPDGINWTKYNDPATTETMYEHSDPVMKAGAFREWDWSGLDFPCVRLRENTWEMFYSGPPHIGYATSTDGINWTRFTNNPILSIDGQSPTPDAVVLVDDVYYLYYTLIDSFDIGVATGTVKWED